MATTNRRSKLIDIIRHQGFATLPDLTAELGVSESTVRRDLNRLVEEGTAKRTHGGVVYTGPAPKAPHFVGLKQANWNYKKQIAAAAAKMVQPGETILLDGGSTTFELAQLLLGKSIQVITNSLPVANHFVDDDSTDLVFVGGVVQSKTGVALGPHATNMLKSLRCRKAFISSAGITESGLFNSNMLLVETEKAMIDCADQTILIADSSKFGQTSLARVCGLEQIDHAIVNAELDDKWQNVLKSAAVQLTLAKNNETS